MLISSEKDLSLRFLNSHTIPSHLISRSNNSEWVKSKEVPLGSSIFGQLLLANVTILRTCVQGNKLQTLLGCNSCGSLSIHIKGPKCRKFHSIYGDPISMTSQQCLIVEGGTPYCSLLNFIWECITYTEL